MNEKDATNVPYPLFELYGPPCKNNECNGVLIFCLDFKTKMLFQRCSVCFIEIPSKDERIIKSIIE